MTSYCVVCDEYWENDTYVFCPYCGEKLIDEKEDKNR